MDDKRIAIPKLEANGSNWATYRDRMTLIIRSRKCGDHLESNTLTQTYQDQWEDVSAARLPRKWDTNEAVTKVLVASTLPDGVFNQIKTKATVKAQWDELKKKYETHTSMNRLNLRSKLMNTRCVEGGNVREVFNQLADIYQQLVSDGVTITDEEYASVLCNSLPPSYESTIDSITVVGETKQITADIVIKFALEAYDCKVAKGEVDVQSIALAALAGGKDGRKRKADELDRGRGRNGANQSAQKPPYGRTGVYRQGGQSAYNTQGVSYNARGGYNGDGRGEATGCIRKPPVCWNCEKVGHIAVCCWAPGGGMDQGKKQSGGVDQPKRRKLGAFRDQTHVLFILNHFNCNGDCCVYFRLTS